MNKRLIKVLPPDLVNKIAAGEVVERPASVVKELVENSIDAGATQIVVEIQDAGKKFIRVSDNGCGMTEDEIEIALQRHSTSKISTLDDLYQIATLGFRGEALPSIASVSKTKIFPNPSGTGITVEVRDLFYNTPVRKKFLKSSATEIGHIGEIVSKYTMAFPNISFKFISDGKLLIFSSGTGKLIDAIIAVYGADLVKELVEIDFPFAKGTISGFVGRPTLTRIDRNYETFYVNKRYIRSPLLSRALEEAYRNLIPNNRYPVGIVFIEIDPCQVDVNVHPTKREVKFVNNQMVMDAIRSAVERLWGNVEDVRVSTQSYHALSKGEREWQPEMMEPFFSAAPMAAQTMEMEVTAVLPLIPIYQLKATYIVATDGEELVLIDQHAAHERILYDQMKSQKSGAISQNLLIPETIECGAYEAMILKDNLDYLNAIGFDIEEFGSDSFILRSVPAVSSRVPAKQLILDIVSELQTLGKSTQVETKQENIRKLIACHSAIKAGDKLTPQEINQLIKDLYSTQNPFTCPHGRPTMIRITEEELIKRFGR